MSILHHATPPRCYFTKEQLTLRTSYPTQTKRGAALLVLCLVWPGGYCPWGDGLLEHTLSLWGLRAGVLLCGDPRDPYTCSSTQMTALFYFPRFFSSSSQFLSSGYQVKYRCSVKLEFQINTNNFSVGASILPRLYL